MRRLPTLTAVFALGAALALTSGTAQSATTHACKDAAVAQAQKLLRFHLGDVANDVAIGDSDSIITRGSVKSLRGKSKIDVLEVTSAVIKTEYRMRFLYARGEGCTLMGQEIFEVSNPG
jgi:hypothetical protein